jgi:hypothetical protein
LSYLALNEARVEEVSLVGVLTQKSLADGLARGAVRPGGRQEEAGQPAPVDVAAAVDAALLAFGDGFSRSSSATVSWPTTTARSASRTARRCCSCGWFRWREADFSC